MLVTTMHFVRLIPHISLSTQQITHESSQKPTKRHIVHGLSDCVWTEAKSVQYFFLHLYYARNIWPPFHAYRSFKHHFYCQKVSQSKHKKQQLVKQLNNLCVYWIPTQFISDRREKRCFIQDKISVAGVKTAANTRVQDAPAHKMHPLRLKIYPCIRCTLNFWSHFLALKVRLICR